MENVNIPATAFKESQCECGCDIFEQSYKISHYKGLLSNGQLLVNMIPLPTCKACGKPWAAEQKPVDPKQKDLFV